MNTPNYRSQSDYHLDICAAFHRLAINNDEMVSEATEPDESQSFCQYHIEQLLHQMLRSIPEEERFEVWKALRREIQSKSYGMMQSHAQSTTSQFISQGKKPHINRFFSQNLDSRLS